MWATGTRTENKHEDTTGTHSLIRKREEQKREKVRREERKKDRKKDKKNKITKQRNTEERKKENDKWQKQRYRYTSTEENGQQTRNSRQETTDKHEDDTDTHTDLHHSCSTGRGSARCCPDRRQSRCRRAGSPDGRSMSPSRPSLPPPGWSWNSCWSPSPNRRPVPPPLSRSAQEDRGLSSSGFFFFSFFFFLFCCCCCCCCSCFLQLCTSTVPVRFFSRMWPFFLCFCCLFVWLAVSLFVEVPPLEIFTIRFQGCCLQVVFLGLAFPGRSTTERIQS